MSRHRLVRNLDYNAELGDYDGFPSSQEDMTEEQRARMIDGLEQVRNILGDQEQSGCTDQAIMGALWVFFFDVDKSVVWLLKEKQKREAAKERKGTIPPPPIEKSVLGAPGGSKLSELASSRSTMYSAKSFRTLSSRSFTADGASVLTYPILRPSPASCLSLSGAFRESRPTATISRLGIPAWKRLTDYAISFDEGISLITAIFSDRDEIEVVGRLRGDDAQFFVDMVDQMLDSLEQRLRKKVLRTLCRICGHQALLPRLLQIPLCYDRSGEALCNGGTADVWKGEHQGLKVAVKVLRVFSTSDIGKVTRRFCKEVMTWKSLRHPNVLPLLGVTMGDRNFAIVSEWMLNGNINQFVKANWNANRFDLLEDVSKGVIYMHSQGMVHGDLKGANIMIDQDNHARLADFGLLTFVSDPTNSMTSGSVANGGTTRWMSPELLYPEMFGSNKGRPTKQSDYYALGMVILEVLGGEPPFARDSDVIVMRKVIDGVRPERPEVAWFTDDLWRTLEKCWSPQPNERPTVEVVHGCLARASGAWRPLPPTAGDGGADSDETDVDSDEVDADSDEAFSTTSSYLEDRFLTPEGSPTIPPRALPSTSRYIPPQPYTPHTHPTPSKSADSSPIVLQRSLVSSTPQQPYISPPPSSESDEGPTVIPPPGPV